MKFTFRNMTRLFFALLIPASILAGCQEDLTEPHAGRPDGEVIVTPPKKK